MAKLPFMRGIQVFQSNSTLRCPCLPPEMRSGRNVGLLVLYRCWERLSQIFRKGFPALSPNADLDHARDDR